MPIRQEILNRSRLGALLLQKGLISHKQLNDALNLQTSQRLKLGEILVQNGWLTPSQVKRVLGNQTRYRFFSSVTSALFEPIKPLMQPHPLMAEPTVSQLTLPFDSRGFSGQTLDDYECLVDVVNHNMKADEEFAIATLTMMADSLIAGADLADGHISIHDVQYEPGPRATINKDGSLDVQLPSHIKKITFHNVAIKGSKHQYCGNVVIHNLSFGDNTSMKIHLF